VSRTDRLEIIAAKIGVFLEGTAVREAKECRDDKDLHGYYK
jgi:hypothetical protein